MKVSREKLLAESTATGFRPDVVEKAIQILGLLEALQGHPFLPEVLRLLDRVEPGQVYRVGS